MTKRCIMLMPEFANRHIIDQIRKEYDPLHGLVDPHVTLVFPFESNITTDELYTHIDNVLKDVKPFRLILQNVVPVVSDGNYLFLDVGDGEKEITQLHDKLYSGLLSDYLSLSHAYQPHLTVGLIKDKHDYQKASIETSAVKDVFSCEISRVYVEVIDENGKSNIELSYSLNG